MARDTATKGMTESAEGLGKVILRIIGEEQVARGAQVDGGEQVHRDGQGCQEGPPTSDGRDGDQNFGTVQTSHPPPYTVSVSSTIHFVLLMCCPTGISN